LTRSFRESIIFDDVYIIVQKFPSKALLFLRFLKTQHVMNQQEMQRAVEKCGLGICWPDIEAGLQGEVLLSPNESKFDDLPIGRTKQGGEPDLPPGMDWPKYSRRGVQGFRNTSKPMTFLMQLRCADLKPFAPRPFPDHGLLSFFVAIEQNELVRDKNGALISRVLYSTANDAETLLRTPFPRGLYFGNRLMPCSLRIESSIGISHDLLIEIVERHCGFSQETYDRVWDFYRQELIPTGYHKIFGPPTTLQPGFAQFSFLELRELEERMLQMAKTDGLLESDTFNDPNGDLLLLEFDLADLPTDDSGRLYFKIHHDDLATCRFHNTLLFG
jgi:hypothetical protein